MIWNLYKISAVLALTLALVACANEGEKIVTAQSKGNADSVAYQPPNVLSDLYGICSVRRFGGVITTRSEGDLASGEIRYQDNDGKNAHVAFFIGPNVNENVIGYSSQHIEYEGRSRDLLVAVEAERTVYRVSEISPDSRIVVVIEVPKGNPLADELGKRLVTSLSYCRIGT